MENYDGLVGKNRTEHDFMENKHIISYKLIFPHTKSAFIWRFT